jgi:hypothetical protein
LADTTVAIIGAAVNLMTPEYARRLRTECETWAQNFRNELFLQQIQQIMASL